MKLEASFKTLENVRNEMRAAWVEWRSSGGIEAKRMREHRKQLKTTGIEVTHKDIVITDKNLLTHNDVHVVIYIKDNTFGGNVFGSSNNLRRIHMSDCATIESMKTRRRFNRYISSDRKDGYFLIDLPRKHNVEAKLSPCKNCLQKLNYKNYASDTSVGNKIVDEFDIKEFFEHYKTKFSQTPFHKDTTAPPSNHTEDQKKSSLEARNRCGWKCEGCEVYLGTTKHRRLLHAHHINAIKSDNRPSNLKCLCILCHKQQPMHGHMWVSNEDERLIKELRYGQGNDERRSL